MLQWGRRRVVLGDDPAYFPYSEEDLRVMFQAVGVASWEELLQKVLPESLRPVALPSIDLPDPISEEELVQELEEYARKNYVGVPWLGMGFFRSGMPAVIRKMVWENPNWYTQYTPYQAEISQGRLEALLLFQTLVADLTGMEIANASLLDGATALVEGVLMLERVRGRVVRRPVHNRIAIVGDLYPHYWNVLRGRADPIGLKLMHVPVEYWRSLPWDQIDGIVVQVPDGSGGLPAELPEVVRAASEQGVLSVVVADPLALLLVEAPGKWGADFVVGTLQRFGLPLGAGGPHPGFLATRQAYVRQLPGRLIGVSRDRLGRIAYRMALQTREQHIRRERATSNICTAQSLPAIVSALFAVYHGEEGLKAIARHVHQCALTLYRTLKQWGFKVGPDHFFDTVWIDVEDREQAYLIEQEARMSGHWIRREGSRLLFACDERTSLEEIRGLLGVLKSFVPTGSAGRLRLPTDLEPYSEEHLPEWRRAESTRVLNHPVFHALRGELRTMRYIRYLEKRDLSMTETMIPLGSCTMKLNRTITLYGLGLRSFQDIHPFGPPESMEGFLHLMKDLEDFLCAITGMDAFTLMPASGAMGELTALLIFRAYFASRDESHRCVLIIPSSAHGTNPASAAQAGYELRVVRTRSDGAIDLNHLDQLLQEIGDRLAGIMITYPSTHGVFEDTLLPVIEKIHAHGGLVYLDGANMNAMLGILQPGKLGVDACHLNLHKTFGIPHGGGGPGVGPVGVRAHLKKFLPAHPLGSSGGHPAGIPAVQGSPWGNGILSLISWAYIRLLGAPGLLRVALQAILNANYLRAHLEKVFPVVYTGEQGFVAHEFLLDFRQYKTRFNIDSMDIAKRLIDFSIHAPTVSFPVPGTMMIEPTETEPLSELNRFIQAMYTIRQELDTITQTHDLLKDNPIKMAPHPVEELVGDWHHPYGREQAVYPASYLRQRKFWSPVARIDDAWGDRNLNCRLPEEAIQPFLSSEPSTKTNATKPQQETVPDARVHAS